MARKVKQTQKQKQKQTVIVNIEQPKAKPRKKRVPRRKPEEVQMYREFPKVVYIPPPLTIYGDRLPEDTRPSITKPTEPPKKTPILEDIGSIGTEGPVQILDVPTKKEQLSELITPVALPAEDSGRAIARSMVEPEKERMRLPDDSVNRLMPSKSDSETTFGFPSSKSYVSDVTMDSGFNFPYTKPPSVTKKESVTSVSDFSFKARVRNPTPTSSDWTLGLSSSDAPVTKKESSSEKSFRFPEPTTFRYSDVEKLGPSPYASESDASKFSGTRFMEQQTGFMKEAQKQYKEKQETPAKKPRRSRKKPRVVDTGGEDVLFGLPPSTEFSGKIPKQIFKEVAPYKPPSKMNKTELENAYKRFSGGQTPPNMTKKDLYTEVSRMVAR